MGQEIRYIMILFIISHWIILRMRGVWDKRCRRKNQNTHFVFNNSFFFFFQKSCLLWDNVERFCTHRHTTDDSIILRNRFPCWINKLHTFIIFHNFIIFRNNYQAKTSQCYVNTYNASLVKDYAFYPTVRLFSWRYNPLCLYFNSPVAGFSLLVYEVSWSHTTTRHIR